MTKLLKMNFVELDLINEVKIEVYLRALKYKKAS